MVSLNQSDSSDSSFVGGTFLEASAVVCIVGVVNEDGAEAEIENIEIEEAEAAAEAEVVDEAVADDISVCDLGSADVVELEDRCPCGSLEWWYCCCNCERQRLPLSSCQGCRPRLC